MAENLTDLLTEDMNVRIDQAENPLGEARKLIRLLDKAILNLRGKIRGQERKVEQTRSRLDRCQKELADAEGETAQAKQLEQEVKESEKEWWDASKSMSDLHDMLEGAEEKVQQVRRSKSTLMARSRRNTSSSDFVPVAASGGVKKQSDCLHQQVEAELSRLKKDRP